MYLIKWPVSLHIYDGMGVERIEFPFNLFPCTSLYFPVCVCVCMCACDVLHLWVYYQMIHFTHIEDANWVEHVNSQ